MGEQDPVVATALERLERSAAGVLAAWPALTWRRQSGPGPGVLTLAAGRFQGLELPPGASVELDCALRLPETIAGTPTAGEPLEVTVDSLYPLSLRCDGRPLLADGDPPVAPPPAFVRVCPDSAAVPCLQLSLSAPRHRTFPSWLRMRFTTPALRRRHEVLDTAWAQLALCAGLARGGGDARRLREAAAALPSRPLELDEDSLAAAAGDLVEALLPFGPRLRQLRAHVVGHAHLDVAWLWRWRDSQEVAMRDVRAVLALMDDLPDVTFAGSQAVLYETIASRAPELLAAIRRRVEEGRWEPATMTWTEGDTNLVSGESLVRQLMEGVQATREALGVEPETLLAPDTFGHSANLPQIARSAGARQYVHFRCNPAGLSHWPAYRWEGLDGTRLLAISTEYRGELTASRIARTLGRARRLGQPSAIVFYGVGNHGGGPARTDVERLRRLRASPLFATVLPSTVSAFAREVRGSRRLPVHAGDLPSIYEGGYSSVSKVKRLNREYERALLTGEAVAVLAGRDDRAALSTAWRAALFLQAHDVLAGTAVEAVYDDLLAPAARVIAEVEHLGAPSPAPEPAAGPILVTNPLPWDREDAVVVPGLRTAGGAWLRDHDGRLVPGQPAGDGLCFVARVAASGTALYRLASEVRDPVPALRASPAGAPLLDGQPAAGEDAPAYLLVETDRVRAYVRTRSGSLASLVERSSGRELVGYGMARPSDTHDSSRSDLDLGVLQVFHELSHFQSAWYLSDVQRETSLLTGGDTAVIEEGPVRLVVRTRHRFGSSSVEQLLTFYRALPRIDVGLAIDWRERGGADRGVPGLKYALTIRSLESQAWFEVPFGAVRRPASGEETCGLRWSAIDGDGFGLAVLNTGTSGCDALGTRLRVTLVRSTYEPAAVPEDGPRTVHLAVVPYLGGWREAAVPRLAAERNQPLLVSLLPAGGAPAAGPGQGPSVEPASIVASCLKRASRSEGTVLRVYESTGRTVMARILGLPPGEVWLADVLERPLRRLARRRGAVELPLGAWKVATLLVRPEMVRR